MLIVIAQGLITIDQEEYGKKIIEYTPLIRGMQTPLNRGVIFQPNCQKLSNGHKKSCEHRNPFKSGQNDQNKLFFNFAYTCSYPIAWESPKISHL